MSRPLRILHVLGALNPGGIEIWLLSILKSLDPQKYRFEFCTFGSEAGLYAAEAQRLGAVVHRCPRFPFHTLGSRFRTILRKGHYDVVHSHVHLFSGAVLRWAQIEKIPIRIAHSHTIDDHKPDRHLRRYYRGLMQSLIRYHSTHGLAASKLAGEELFAEAWQKDKRFGVLHYGVDLDQFQNAFHKDEIRRELGIPVDAPVVGHVGRFVYAKNHDFLLQIAVEVLTLRPDIHFLFVGDGPLKNEVEKQSRAMHLSRNVHISGNRNDIPRIMQGCMDIFLFPSLWEGFGLVLIEAQAAGLPCVVSDRVSEETSIFHTRIFRLSLSKDSREWSTAVIRALSLSSLKPEETLSSLSQTNFCIRKSSALIAQIYAGVNQSDVSLSTNEAEMRVKPSDKTEFLGPNH